MAMERNSRAQNTERERVVGDARPGPVNCSAFCETDDTGQWDGLHEKEARSAQKCKVRPEQAPNRNRHRVAAQVEHELNGLGFAAAVGKHCTAHEGSTTSSASNMLNCATAIKRKGRLTAMFPIKPDSCTFNLAVTNARTNNTKAAVVQRWHGVQGVAYCYQRA